MKVPVIVRLEGTNVDQGKRILKVNVRFINYHIMKSVVEKSCLICFLLSIVQQESGMALITAEDLDDAAQKAVKAAYK